MWAGDYQALEFTVTGITDATDVDEASWVLRASATGSDLITKSLGTGISVATGTESVVVTVTLDPDDTAGLCGTYLHELELTDVSGHPVTVATGTARIEYSMT